MLASGERWQVAALATGEAMRGAWRSMRVGQRVLVPAQFRIDEDLLREMASTAGGEYFHASDSAGLGKVYAQIDRLEKSEFNETKYSEYTELFSWFAGPGLALVLAVGVLNETRFRSLP